MIGSKNDLTIDNLINTAMLHGGKQFYLNLVPATATKKKMHEVNNLHCHLNPKLGDGSHLMESTNDMRIR